MKCIVRPSADSRHWAVPGKRAATLAVEVAKRWLQWGVTLPPGRREFDCPAGGSQRQFLRCYAARWLSITPGRRSGDRKLHCGLVYFEQDVKSPRRAGFSSRPIIRERKCESDFSKSQIRLRSFSSPLIKRASKTPSGESSTKNSALPLSSTTPAAGKRAHLRQFVHRREFSGYVLSRTTQYFPSAADASPGISLCVASASRYI